MGSVYDKLLGANLLTLPPSSLKNNIHYEVITGSTAYGCNEPGKSDLDIVGFYIPPKDVVFRHLAGRILHFDDEPVLKPFQQHHIKHDSGTEYDICMYNIVQFFKLCMENNPNMIDCLFVPRTCVIFSTAVGEHIRDNAQLFLTKHSYHKFTGYAKSQLHKLQSKKIVEFIELCNKYNLSYNITEPDISFSDIPLDIYTKLVKLINEIDKDGKRTKRIESIAKYGYDVKFAYHLFRLLLECEQILTDHTLILNRDREIYKSVRRGDYTKEQVLQYFDDGEIRLRKMYDESTLRNIPDVNGIRQLLINCLEMHYGTLENCVANLNKHEMAIRDIQQILGKYKL